MTTERLVEFCTLIPGIRGPRRAERSAAGYLPSRAMRWCDALTSATGFGYWVFSPVDLRFLWDGELIQWSYGEDEAWLPLSATQSGAVQFPGFAEQFDAVAPDFLQGYSPPFVTALPEAGAVQIWTGLLAKTRPGWSLLVRAPANLPPMPGLAHWEGVIETDLWYGPLFSNFRITRTNEPVHIRKHVPFLQVQPIPQLAYRDEVQADFTCVGSDALGPDDWERLGEVLLPHPDSDVRQGAYAAMVRKRRHCPAHTDLLPKT